MITYSAAYKEWHTYRMIIKNIIGKLPGFDESKISKYNYVFVFIDEDSKFTTFVHENDLTTAPVEFSYEKALFIARSLHESEFKPSILLSSDKQIINLTYEKPKMSNLIRLEGIGISSSTSLPILIGD